MLGLTLKNGSTSYIEDCSYILRNMNKDTYFFRVYCCDEYSNRIIELIEEAIQNVS